ncbi:MAG TPA: bifunctional DNA-formamidopyrimidine glycosylase/DNA-(apurinic or apyrimidinic site) lyase [Anaerolineales bacterium]|nr:bifunctional DNA-formamidopyrimidine glycosylase/DNA-(apurinic or apyrimidinic site) lyase [Anaerolineales bacterium]
MPELPEVETIARNLRDGHSRETLPTEGTFRVREPRAEYVPALPSTIPVTGKTITGAQVFWPRTLAEPGETAFYHQIIGQRIENVGRRAKYLILYLSEQHLIIHLRMSGDIIVTPLDQPLAPHDRLTLTLDDQYRLAFNDTRKFGRVWLMNDPTPLFADLGPEPFSDEFTPEWLYNALQQKNRHLKPLLLDQTFLAGLGNIYTDESLHRAGLHPLTPSGRVSPEQAARLRETIREVLNDGIRHNGSSIDWVYRGGGFQNYFRVYGRTGEPCLTCGTPISRIVVGQRSTHFCPRCQPEISTHR